ncbi:MAG: hypothetical protein JSW25_07445, partial [Thermoplasmata archaeon]
MIIMLVTMAWSVTAGESRVHTLNDNHQQFRYQSRAGDLDYDTITPSEVWNSGKENVSTAVLSFDMNDDDVAELVFGTDAGRLVAVELGTWF